MKRELLSIWVFLIFYGTRFFVLDLGEEALNWLCSAYFVGEETSAYLKSIEWLKIKVQTLDLASIFHRLVLVLGKPTTIFNIG